MTACGLCWVIRAREMIDERLKRCWQYWLKIATRIRHPLTRKDKIIPFSEKWQIKTIFLNLFKLLFFQNYFTQINKNIFCKTANILLRLMTINYWFFVSKMRHSFNTDKNNGVDDGSKIFSWQCTVISLEFSQKITKSLTESSDFKPASILSESPWQFIGHGYSYSWTILE